MNKFSCVICWLMGACQVWAGAVTPVCKAVITADNVVATAEQRLLAGEKAEPPLTDMANGFAWPDTPIGVVKDGEQYLFFGSDGAMHARQEYEGRWYGNNKYGSATRATGTLANPLGSAPPLNVSIRENPDPAVNPNYSSYDYIGGGPVYKVPSEENESGRLLMVYHAEIPTVTTQSFYSVLGLAASRDNGHDWVDLGEIIRVNQGYRSDLDGYDIGDPPLVLSRDGKYFHIYFRDWLANGTTHWNDTITSVSVARAPVAELIRSAFNRRNPRTVPFQKYYAGGWDQEQGLGGYSSDLNPTAEYAGESQVIFNSALNRYVMIIGEGVVVGYSESPDGLAWSLPTLIHDFRNDPDQPSVYVMPVGSGSDPSVFGKSYFIYYTRYPSTGAGWGGATLHRFTLACQ